MTVAYPNRMTGDGILVMADEYGEDGARDLNARPPNHPSTHLHLHESEYSRQIAIMQSFGGNEPMGIPRQSTARAVLLAKSLHTHPGRYTAALQQAGALDGTDSITGSTPIGSTALHREASLQMKSSTRVTTRHLARL